MDDVNDVNGVAKHVVIIVDKHVVIIVWTLYCNVHCTQ